MGSDDPAGPGGDSGAAGGTPGPGEENLDEPPGSGDDDEDLPAPLVAAAGSSADPVKDYLRQIGKVPLLNASQEVELARRIEAGLFAEEKLAGGSGMLRADQSVDLEEVAADGRRAKDHLVEANLRLVVSLARRYTGRGMLGADLAAPPAGGGRRQRVRGPDRGFGGHRARRGGRFHAAAGAVAVGARHPVGT